jgi:hypothetical protein
MSMEPNKPEIVAEIRDLFERYEQALIEKDVDVLDATFWNSPHTIRLSFDEHGYGFDEIHAHRVRRPPGPGTKEERQRLDILTLGDDFATVNLVFKMRGQDRIGRQSQTWVRFPDVGWKVVSAHVSRMD